MVEQSFSCKRICLTIKAPVVNNAKRYRPGVKRCGSCGGGIFIKTIKHRCPCCNERLRSKAKNSSKNKDGFEGY